MKKHMQKNNQTVFIGTLIVLVVIVLALSAYIVNIRTQNQSTSSQAEELLNLQSSSISTNSTYFNKQDVAFFDMTAGDLKGKLYGLKSNNEQDVLNFLSADPQLEVQQGNVLSLIPDKPENLRLNSTINDNQEAYLLDAGHHIDAMHYYFDQTRCGNIPVFGGNLQIHTSQSNVYAVSGALIKNDVDCTQSINESQAHSVALEAYAKDTKSGDGATVQESTLYVFSPAIMDSTLEDHTNHLTQFVNVCGAAGDCKGYFVDMKSGKAIYSVQTSMDALNRKVTLGGQNCDPAKASTPKSTERIESGGPSGNDKVDKTFDIIGNTYNYFNSTHQLDSFDGAGASINTELPSCSDNACWTGAKILICSGLVASDVIAHEFTHAVTQYAVGGQSLIYRNESGALNESLSDVFAYALDPANWTMGETTSLGAIRDFADPPKHGHPSRVFSSVSKDGASYYCSSGDNGGVHINSGVFNKAFYLMVDGGSFNGCTITGLGHTNYNKAHLVIFRALKTYMKGKNTGNYRDMYDAVVQACNDVYKTGSPECATITAAMQATEMDQQTIGASKGPACTGLTAKPATCIGSVQPTGSSTPAVTPGTSGAPTPITTGIPTSPTIGPSGSPSQPAKSSPLKSSVSSPQSATGDVSISYDGTVYKLVATISEAAFNSFFTDAQPTAGESARLTTGFEAGVPIRGELVGPDTIDTGTFTFEGGKYTNKYSTGKDLSKYTVYQVVAINDSGNEIPFLIGNVDSSASGSGGTGGSSPAPSAVRLSLSLRLQGIDKKPKSTEAILVRVGVGGGDLAETVYKNVLFTPSDGGVWKGQADFDIPEGTAYKVLVKGPKHTQRKICENKPKEDQPGLYKCTINTIELKKGDNTLDFSGVVMLAGDLPVKQDGIVNAKDVLAVRERLNKTDFESLAIGDVNYDGVINAVDDALVVFTLANRTDQN